jgi:hypothetical protein
MHSMVMAGKDNRRHRDPMAETPTLGATVLMNAIQELVATRRLVDARVVYKMSARGEHVVAIIFPPQPP